MPSMPLAPLPMACVAPGAVGDAQHSTHASTAQIHLQPLPWQLPLGTVLPRLASSTQQLILLPALPAWVCSLPLSPQL